MREWIYRNQDAISWWVIGWLSFSVVDSLAKGSYIWALISLALIWLNYKLIKN